jgi:hypothetical protein
MKECLQEEIKKILDIIIDEGLRQAVESKLMLESEKLMVESEIKLQSA